MAISRNEIMTKLKEVFEMVMGNDKLSNDITFDANLIDDLNLNSIGMLYLVIGIEESFNISFDDASFNDFKTINDVIEYIYNKSNNE